MPLFAGESQGLEELNVKWRVALEYETVGIIPGKFVKYTQSL